MRKQESRISIFFNNSSQSHYYPLTLSYDFTWIGASYYFWDLLESSGRLSVLSMSVCFTGGELWGYEDKDSETMRYEQTMHGHLSVTKCTVKSIHLVHTVILEVIDLHILTSYHKELWMKEHLTNPRGWDLTGQCFYKTLHSVFWYFKIKKLQKIHYQMSHHKWNIHFIFFLFKTCVLKYFVVST